MSDPAGDLDVLYARLRAALPPSLLLERVRLEHSDTREIHPALVIGTHARKKDCVYRMTVMLIGDEVNFYVHVHGVSKDLTTQDAQHFSKKGVTVDEVFAMAHNCWMGGEAS